MEFYSAVVTGFLSRIVLVNGGNENPTKVDLKENRGVGRERERENTVNTYDKYFCKGEERN